MSTLVTTNIQTANGTTDLTIKTGNTSGAGILINANGTGFVFQGNSSANVMTVNSTAVTYLGTQTINVATIAVGSVTVNASGITSNGTSYVANGFYITPGNWGVINANVTMSASNGNYQYATTNAAFTWTAPTTDCAIDILITNGSGAGTITFSGFTVQSGGTGDTYATTNNNKYLVSVRRINSVSTYLIKALQ